jgi:hypothetical protein
MYYLYSVLAFLFFSVTSFYTLWIFYLALMNLDRAKGNGTLTSTALYLGYPLLGVGYALDIFLNLTVCTILFLEVPRELTVTSRLSRHILDQTGYRKLVALWMCTNLLNTFDPSGTHCS